MKFLSIKTSSEWPLIGRLMLLVVLYIIQVETVEIALRDYYDGSTIQQSVWAPIQGYQLYFFSFIVVFPAAFAIISWKHLREQFSSTLKLIENNPWQSALGMQLLSYAVFGFLTYQMSVNYQSFAQATAIVFIAWVFSMLMTGYFSLLTLAPQQYWIHFLQTEYRLLLLAAMISIAITASVSILILLAPSLGGLTLSASEMLVRLIYDDVIFDFTLRKLGTPAFTVRVSNLCAGYEGIALISFFLATYLWLFRKDFRFPQAFLAFPIGIVVIWTFNVIRITTLIVIGDAVSKEIAIAGFHSNAGWISFILVSIGMISLLHRCHFFSSENSSLVTGQSNNAADGLLLPFIVLMATTLLSAAFTAGFDWLYPVKAIATGMTLYYFWQHYEFNRYKIKWEAIAIGAIVFLIWIIGVPVSIEQDKLFSLELIDASPLLVIFWLFFRFIGSAIIVPLAEELLFRQYLLIKLIGIKPSINQSVHFTWFSFLLSSLLFGLLHNAWIAGTLAGMGFAIARYRGGKIADAVVSHMVTNLLLSIYAMSTQQWSYW